ncbi:MAG: hypothetical protein ACRERS_04220 [Methylococcales bacterium]
MNKQVLIEQRIAAQHRVIAERLRQDPHRVMAKARHNLSRWSEHYAPHERPAWMREWGLLLDGSLDEVLTILLSDSEKARRLRSSSLFAGILSARERWALLKRINDET